MKKTALIRLLPAALALALASIGLSAAAQTQPAPPAQPAAQPTTVEKMENAGEKAWTGTKKTTKKAVHATKRTTKKVAHATGNVAHKAGTAVSNTATAAADKTRQVGDKIGEKIPGTPQNEAAKKP